jgi:acyl carrier protein
MCTARNEIVRKLCHLVAAVVELDADEVDADALFYDELEIDSLQKAEISARVEREFGVRLDPQDTAAMRTVTDVANFLLARGITVAS